MKKRVAVEQTLRNVGQFLSEKGYEIASLDPLSESQAELHNVSAVIISGQDENMLGMEDRQTKAPVIDARGMTAENVYQQLQQLEQKAKQQNTTQQQNPGKQQTNTQQQNATQLKNVIPQQNDTQTSVQKAYKGMTKTEV